MGRRFSLYLDRACDARIWDVDGHTHAEFALGDTGAMAGHSPAAVADAVRSRVSDRGGITAMLPTEDAEWVAAELSRRFGLPWSVVQRGARAEFRYLAPAPRDGNSSAAAADPALDEYFHLFLANRGVLITPFHNMTLMSPATAASDVDLHTELFTTAVDQLLDPLPSPA
jgi:glutamate-1-semialdehyde aminotransferase